MVAVAFGTNAAFAVLLFRAPMPGRGAPRRHADLQPDLFRFAHLAESGREHVLQGALGAGPELALLQCHVIVESDRAEFGAVTRLAD